MSGEPALRIVDARSGGDVSRVIVDGAPGLRGVTVKEQCADFARRFDHLRLKLIQPPYGALHMCPVLLLPPRRSDTDFGVIIMESMGYPPISGPTCSARPPSPWSAVSFGFVSPKHSCASRLPAGSYRSARNAGVAAAVG